MCRYCIFLHITKLLMQKRVTTYGQKGYYLRVKGLLLTGNGLICVMFFTYKCTFESSFHSKRNVNISITT